MSKKIISFIIIVVLIAAAFWYLQNSQSTDSSLTAQVQAPQSVDAKYIYGLLQKMKEVRLDDSIFSNTTFLNLRDNSVTLSPQTKGRNNPFAPLGTGGSF